MTLALETAHFDNTADPEHPGWLRWDVTDERRFNAVTLGKMLVRKDEDGKARLRMFPSIAQSNIANAVHGGITLALIDVSMFAAARVNGILEIGTAVTLDLSTHFIGAGRIDEPLDAVVEVLRETGRLVFMRGLVVQGDHLVAGFSGTIRRSSPPK